MTVARSKRNPLSSVIQENSHQPAHKPTGSDAYDDLAVISESQDTDQPKIPVLLPSQKENKSSSQSQNKNQRQLKKRKTTSNIWTHFDAQGEVR